MNRSEILIDTDVCKTCGRCCKHFVFFFGGNDGLPQRMKLLHHPDIKVEPDGEYDNGEKRFKITIDYPCSKLAETADGFRCQIYGEIRPLLCEQYPYRGEGNECP